jgi:endonuclease VIII
MPEGHSIHRYARLHRQALAGERLAVSSPQGRFSEGAGELDGQVLRGVDAYGKHLFYRWGNDRTLHVHLGLFGTFRTHRGAAPAPSAGTRLAFRAERPDVTVYLSGPVACELIDPATEDALRARLGPDPLVTEGVPPVFGERLGRRRGPIGQALLDQSVVAGVGNAFRAEVLFLCGIDPTTPARALSSGQVDALWWSLRRLLRDGERTGRIDTAVREAAEADGPSRYVYRRGGSPCRRCGTPIRAWELGGRTMYACPTCQPLAGAADGTGAA